MMAIKDKREWHYLMYFALIGANFIYACTAIFTKSASQHQFVCFSVAQVNKINMLNFTLFGSNLLYLQ